MKGYVLVRYHDEEVLPAVIEQKDGYVCMGDEVMLDEMNETAICVSPTEGIADPEKAVARIAKLFERDVENLPRVISTITRTYWKKDEPEKDWRADA